MDDLAILNTNTSFITDSLLMTTSLTKAYYLAISIYMNVGLREIIDMAEMHYLIAARLRSALVESALQNTLEISSLIGATNSIISTWTHDLPRLLWISSIGGSVTSGRPERLFFVSILLRVRDLMKLSSLEGFRDVLRWFGWLGRFHEPHSKGLWDEMEELVVQDLTVREQIVPLPSGLSDLDALPSGGGRWPSEGNAVS
jgi:hypothetical protein